MTVGSATPFVALAAAFLLATAPASSAAPSAAQPFDAAAAWREFDELVRLRYGYLERPGIHGDAILRHFAPAAEATKTPPQFIDVLQLVAHNFADPHFIVGPLNDDDYAVFPTSADLFAEGVGESFSIVDVRRDSDAAARGVTPGARVVTIDGLSPQLAIERALGRPFAELSREQKNAGINIALAGRRHHRRSLVLASGAETRSFDLAPTNALADSIAARAPVTVDRRPGGVAVIRIENSLGNNATIQAFAGALNSVRDSRRLVIDLRNTPSGGNTTVARGILGHFVDREHPYQIHVVPGRGAAVRCAAQVRRVCAPNSAPLPRQGDCPGGSLDGEHGRRAYDCFQRNWNPHSRLAARASVGSVVQRAARALRRTRRPR